MDLAISSYGDPRIFEAEGDHLNLALTVDEREHLRTDIVPLFEAALKDEALSHLPLINDYSLNDPYGANKMASPMRRHFGEEIGDVGLTCASGVNSLLHALATFCIDGSAYVIGDVYPDFPCWVERFGGRCVGGDYSTGVEGHVARAVDLDCKVIHFDRPCLLGGGYELSDVIRLCDGAARHGIVVLIDESYANYHPPAFSAVNVVDRVPNLAVLRGMSKAYWLGGLRFGACVSSRCLTAAVQSRVAPVQVSSLTLHLASIVYSLGDVTSSLRDRVAESKKAVVGRLSDVLAAEELCSPPHIPYVFLPLERSTDLEGRGILGKTHKSWSGARARPEKRYRISVPLRAERMAQMLSRLR